MAPSSSAASVPITLPLREDHRPTGTDFVITLVFAATFMVCVGILSYNLTYMIVAEISVWLAAKAAPFAVAFALPLALPQVWYNVPDNAAAIMIDPWPGLGLFSSSSKGDPRRGQLEHGQGSHVTPPWFFRTAVKLIDTEPFKQTVTEDITVGDGNKITYEGYIELSAVEGNAPTYNTVQDDVILGAAVAHFQKSMIAVTRNRDPLQCNKQANLIGAEIRALFEQADEDGTLPLPSGYGVVARRIEVTDIDIDEKLREALAARQEAGLLREAAQHIKEVGLEEYRLAAATAGQLNLHHYSFGVQGLDPQTAASIAQTVQGIAAISQRFSGGTGKTGKPPKRSGGKT